MPKIRQRPDASLAEVMPTSAPAATSVSQWRLSLIRDQPTAVASPYRPTVAQGRWMSSASEVASAKATAVCPTARRPARRKGIAVGVEALLGPGPAEGGLAGLHREARERQ